MFPENIKNYGVTSEITATSFHQIVVSHSSLFVFSVALNDFISSVILEKIFIVSDNSIFQSVINSSIFLYIYFYFNQFIRQLTSQKINGINGLIISLKVSCQIRVALKHGAFHLIFYNRQNQLHPIDRLPLRW